jgi:hypothetical protein
LSKETRESEDFAVKRMPPESGDEKRLLFAFWKVIFEHVI